MKELISQAFVDVDKIGPYVMAGHYNLVGPDNEVILPAVWETVIQPGWHVSMQMWAVSETRTTHNDEELAAFEDASRLGDSDLPGSGRPRISHQERPFRCPMNACTSTGFQTLSDFVKHLEGVHDVDTGAITPYFICQGRNCNRINKLWPRLDNFRRHVARMHPNEDAEDLLRRYSTSFLWVEKTLC
jgi:hypothetical protein